MANGADLCKEAKKKRGRSGCASLAQAIKLSTKPPFSPPSSIHLISSFEWLVMPFDQPSFTGSPPVRRQPALTPSHSHNGSKPHALSRTPYPSLCELAPRR
ncbi:hypothetical protein PAXRUDRAFT_15979 [Paxillus rubicundulus Ve08.2h10]|uniref:Uncharacterized protein n=1 Tax=Paxillus rubicundulus Ve08.2h10 TaxID=930991 RepID=A0A0D0DNC6_9AGAM|nr:hypothetical protein PAXRUDRAFT_15979 [Paxillus rubicundulus Ve08.2h10]